MLKDRLLEHVQTYPNFPKPGVSFKDLTPLMTFNGLREINYRFDEFLRDTPMGVNMKTVVGIESRGFIFGTSFASYKNRNFTPVRKPGKLPGPIHSYSYKTEYSEDTLQIQSTSKLGPIVIVDDILATGGTALAAWNLADTVGIPIMCLFVGEIVGLGGRKVLEDNNIPFASILEL